MAAPDLRTAVRTGAAHLDRMAESPGRPSSATAASRSRPTRPSSTSTTSSAATRWTSASTRALSGLGFARDEWAKPPTAMSGGEQTRASLARLVIADPTCCCSTSPTNHLDLDALEWLEDHLRKRAGLAAGGLARPGVPRRDRGHGSGSCATAG